MGDELKETLGTVIRRKRKQMRLSQREVASQVKIHHSTIDRIEKDYFKVVNPETLINLADTLHLDRLYLLALNGASVQDKDIRIIARAANKMSSEERVKMMAILRDSFPKAFMNTASDDLDQKDKYTDKPV